MSDTEQWKSLSEFKKWLKYTLSDKKEDIKPWNKDHVVKIVISQLKTFLEVVKSLLWELLVY